MLAMFGIACFFAVGLLVSVRLLALWRDTRQVPELLGALGLLGIGPLGFCVVMTGFLLFRDTPQMPVLRAAGLGVQSLGFVATACFTWRVFRPNDWWATALTAGISLGLLSEGIALFAFPGPPGEFGPWNHLSMSLKILCLGWGAFESLRYWRISSRRVAIGFADPLVSASFLMWGIALGSGALGFVVVYASIVLLGPGGHLSVPIQLVLSTCGVITAAALYLSFLPPRAYRRRVEARAPSAGG